MFRMRGRAAGVRTRTQASAVEDRVREKADPRRAGHLAAPFAGALAVLVVEGEQVAAGQVVARLEAMKLEASITAPRAGTVTRVVAPGTGSVEGGDLILELR